MPGLISPLSAASVGAVAGMKRAFAAESAPTYGEPHPKKRKVIHKLHNTQPVQHIAEPLNGGFGAAHDQEFFDQQLRRAIAIQCKGIGFDSARPEVLEEFRSLVDTYMTSFLSEVRKSMSSSRRAEPVAHDWIYALSRSGISGSASLEKHLDTGTIPATILQPACPPPPPKEPAPPNLEGLLGPELSGRSDKDSRRYIPRHFPPFPSRHTYQSTPVFQKRSAEASVIRDKAAQEGIEAEKSLRTLMAAQKAGLQHKQGAKRKKSRRMEESDALFRAAIEEAWEDEKDREEKEKKRRAALQHEDDEWEVPAELPRSPQPARKVNLEEGVQVNYDRKYWRKSARGV